MRALLTLQKRIALGGHQATVRLEAFNALNIPLRTFNSDTSAIRSDGFGQYASVSQPRAIQLTLRYGFEAISCR